MSLLQSIRAPLLRWVLSGTDTVAKFQKFCGVTLPPNTATPLKPSCDPSPSSSAKQPSSSNSHNGTHAASTLPRGVPIITNRLAFIYFHTAAAAGNELFYIVFLPLLFWLVDVDLARRVSLLWGCVYAIGQSVKDLLELPRPPSPPVARLESHYETEYGFPSTHAMIALVLPWYSLIVWSQLGYETNWTLGLIAATVWTVSITLSRLYVGVHSVCDLVGGLVLGGLVLAFGWACGATIDEFVIHSLASPPAALLVSYSVIYLYPAPASWTNAYGDTALIIATVAGISCASSDWTGRLPSLNPALFASKLSLVGFYALRMLVGCSILFSTRSVMKLVAQQIWLPLILPKYFAFCSQLAAPTRVGGVGDEHADASPLCLRNDSPRTNKNAAAAEEQWELTPMDGSVPPPGLHQRGVSEPQRVVKVASATAGAAAAASSSAAGTTVAAGSLRRPVARPPQQFRLRVETGAFAASVAAAADKLDLSRPSSPLDALLHGSSPPHTLRVSSDPSDPSSPSLACFEAAGHVWYINPLHVYLVEVPIKYVTYFSVGFNAVWVCPLVFAKMGI